MYRAEMDEARGGDGLGEDAGAWWRSSEPGLGEAKAEEGLRGAGPECDGDGGFKVKVARSDEEHGRSGGLAVIRGGVARR